MKKRCLGGIEDAFVEKSRKACLYLRDVKLERLNLPFLFPVHRPLLLTSSLVVSRIL